MARPTLCAAVPRQRLAAVPGRGLAAHRVRAVAEIDLVGLIPGASAIALIVLHRGAEDDPYAGCEQAEAAEHEEGRRVADPMREAELRRVGVQPQRGVPTR